MAAPRGSRHCSNRALFPTAPIVFPLCKLRVLDAPVVPFAVFVRRLSNTRSNEIVGASTNLSNIRKVTARLVRAVTWAQASGFDTPPMTYKSAVLLGMGLIYGCAAGGSSVTGGAGAGSGSSAGNSNGDSTGNAAGDSSGSNNDDSGGSNGSANADGGACAADTFKADLKPSALVFQIDTSGSMNCPITNASCLADDPTNDPNDSRWDVFRATLNDVLTELPDTLAVGLMHFPNPNTGCAPTMPLVAVDALSTSRSAISSQLASLIPEYITPTRDAVQNALKVAKARNEENRFVVLATDGAATVCLGCNAGCANAGKVPASESEALVSDVKAALDADGIRTFVIGVPGSQTYRSELSKVAEAGGTGREQNCSHTGPNYCHYDLTDATVDFGALLSSTLAAISGSVLACDFAVPTTSDFDPNKVNVSLTTGAATTSLKRDPNEMNGWNYTPDGKTIRLFGPACEAAKQVTEGKIDILYGCPTVVLI